MSSSKKSSTTTYDTAGLKEARPYVVGQLGRTDEAYGNMQAGLQPGGMVGMGGDFMRNVLQGQYLDPASNPYLQKYAQGAIGDVTNQFNTMMGRAGRGNFTGGDAQQNLAQGIMSAAAPIYFNAYNQGMGQLQNMALAAPSYNVAAYGAPAEWANQQFIGLSGTGKSGTEKTTSTSSPSVLSSIAGAALTGLGAFTANPQMAAAGLSSLAGGGGMAGGYGGNQQGPAAMPSTWGMSSNPWGSSWNLSGYRAQ
jgi:hypothetical protein